MTGSRFGGVDLVGPGLVGGRFEVGVHFDLVDYFKGVFLNQEGGGA